MRKFIQLFILLLITILPSLQIVQAQSDDRLVIATTATHVADLARVIAGDRADVFNIITPGLNPHSYRFTEGDATVLGAADMVLFNGLGFEGFVEITLQDYERQKPVYGVLTIVRDQGLALGSSSELVNSHAWHDPRNWILAAQGLADFLSYHDPDYAEHYQVNATQYIEQLELLRTWTLDAMSLVPEDARVIISSHDAFAYLAYAYNWRRESVQGINTADEAGISEIQAITNFVIDNNIHAVFTESSLPADTIEAVVASARSQGWDVNIGGELLGDSLTEQGTFTGTYIGMVHYNITLIVTASGYGDAMPPFPADLPQPSDYEQDT